MFKGPVAESSQTGNTDGVMERRQYGGSSGNTRNDERRGLRPGSLALGSRSVVLKFGDLRSPLHLPSIELP